MMNYWKHSAEILITYFHAISQGNIPLTIDWKEEDRQAAGMDERAMAFVAHLRSLVDSRCMYSGPFAASHVMQLTNCTSWRAPGTSERPARDAIEMDFCPPSASERGLR